MKQTGTELVKRGMAEMQKAVSLWMSLMQSKQKLQKLQVL